MWQASVTVPAVAVAAVETLLEPFGLAVSTYEIPPGRDWIVEILSDLEPDAAALDAAVRDAAAIAGIDPPELEIAPLQPADWVQMSLGKLPPVAAGRFYIHGSHDAGTAPAGALALCVDAGQAFGTGQHATTRGCLLELDRLKRRRGRARGAVLDLGCGTGVLAMAAARAWPGRRPILGIDIDGLAVAAARGNARQNRLRRRLAFVEGDGLRHPAARRAGPFALITANILAGPLCRLAPGLAHSLDRGGILILSGLLARQRLGVLAAYRRAGLKVMRVAGGDWRVLVFRRAAGSGPRGPGRLRLKAIGWS